MSYKFAKALALVGALALPATAMAAPITVPIVKNELGGSMRVTPVIMVSPTGEYVPADGGAAWSYAAASGGISNTTTAVTLVAATAAKSNYVTACQISADTLGAATEVAIRDGAAGTVLWRIKIPTGGLATADIVFPTPLKSSANTLLEAVTLTATVTGGVFINCQGYVGV